MDERVFKYLRKNSSYNCLLSISIVAILSCSYSEWSAALLLRIEVFGSADSKSGLTISNVFTMDENKSILVLTKYVLSKKNE